MKKRFLIFIVAILALMLCAVACNSQPAEGEVTVKSVELVSGTVSTECNVGDTLDFSGIKVKVTYSDNTTKEIGYSDVQVSAIDTSTAGEKTVTVTYGAFTFDFKITVKEVVAAEATLTSIKIVPGSVPSALYIGQSFDTTKLQIEANYSDGSKKILSYGDVTATAVDATTAGDKTFTVTYGGMTDSVTVKVHGITSVKVVSGTIATKVAVGATLDTSALQVYVTYGDGIGKTVSATELTVGTLDTATYGKKTVDITYNGITIKHNIEVVGAKSISVLSGSVPTSVKVGATYDASNIKATLLYSDNTQEDLDASKLTVSTIDTATAGEKTLTVTYGSLSTTVTVKVVGVETLTVATNSVSGEVLKGATLDTSKIQVSVKFTDGTSTVVGASALTLGTIDTTTAGDKKLSVTYLDKTVEYTVKVCEITSIRVEGVATSVQSGKAIDITGMKVYGVYNDSKKTAVELTEGVTTNIADLNVPEVINGTAARTLTVTCGQLSTSLTIYATDPELIGIEVTNYDKEVLQNAAYNYDNIVVYAKYGNGTSARIFNFTMTEVRTNLAGETSFDVVYKEYVVALPVKVCTITSLNIVGVPVYAPSGEEIDISGMKVFGVYNDTAATMVELKDGIITTNIEELNTTLLDSTDPRILTVNYSGMYGEHSTTYTIDTTEPLLENIVIQSYPAEILLGGEFSKENVQVIAIFGNGQQAPLEAKDFTMSEVNTNVASDSVSFTVSYTFGGIVKTASATFKVCKITKLEIDGVESKVKYGEKVDVSGMQVYGVYNDKAQTRVLLTEGYTTNIDAINANLSSTANRVLVITYGNVQAEFEITVSAPELIGIEISGYDKTIGIGGSYDKESVTVNGVYEDGHREPITEGFTVEDVATGTVGTTKLKVKYGNLDAEADVTVLGIASLEVSGIATTVNKGYPLNTEGVTVTVTFTDGSTRVVTKADGVTVDTPDVSTGGDKSIKVYYLGESTSFTYHVKAVEKIEIFNGLPYVIREGYAIDYSNLKIKIIYSNGDEDVVATANLVGVTYTGTNVGDTTFTVTYEGKTASRDLVQATLHQVHALNGTIPGSILAKNDLPYADFRITLVYRYFVGGVEQEDIILIKMDDPNLVWYAGKEYHESGYVPASYISVIGIDTSKAGDRIIQFIYMPSITNEMGIPLYMAQAKVLVVDVAGISVVHGSVPSSVKLNGEYDTSGLQVQVNYTDGSYKYVSINELTSVSTIDTSIKGDQNLTVTYTGPSGVHTATYTVNVVDTGASVNGVIFGAMLPDSLIARDTYKNNFKDNDNIYVVGDDNPYVLYLNVAVLDSNNKLVDVNGKDVATVTKVYEITNGANTLLEGDALAAVVSISADGHSYQFQSAAAEREFRLEIAPASAPYLVVKHEIKVVDGYNVYDEKELNLITNSYGEWTCEDLNENITSLGRLDQGEVAKAFLVANGITTDPSSINAIILHRNMNIEVEDLPSEYFHTYTKNGVEVTELIDMLEVYQRLVANDQPFTFYGNYYSVFSYNLPCVVPKNVWNNIDEYSNSTLFSFRLDIRGYWSIDMSASEIDWPSDNQIANIVDVGFRDNDPNSNDQSANDRHMRGLTCITNKGLTTNVTNVNVEAFVVAMRSEGVNCTINLDQVKFYNCWQGQIFVWNDNGFQLDNWNNKPEYVDYPTLPGMFGTKINITDSLLAKCGGPVILAQSNRSGEAANKETGVDVVVDHKSELYSYVTGQEAWFVAVNQTPMAAQIMALNQVVSGTAAPQGINASYTSNQKIEGVNTMNMVMVVMGVGVDPNNPEEFNASFTRINENGEAQVMMQMIKNKSVNNPDMYQGPYNLPWIYDCYMSNPATAQAPIFVTSAGGHFFGLPFDEPSLGLNAGGYTVDFTTGIPSYATGSAFQGDYITMHMYGMGIMLEYYND